MVEPTIGPTSLTETDLEFVVGEAASEVVDKERLKQLISEDEDFRKAMVGDEQVFRRVVNDEEVFLKISPSLYFEVLLRRSVKELETVSHTVERTGKQNIPVFDTREVAALLARPGALYYLAQMLASFTRTHSYVVSERVRRGVRRRVRYNDMDIDNLLRMCDTADEEQRLGFYKRIGDVCLFISGVFPEYTFFASSYPGSGQLRSPPPGKRRRSMEDYEREGQRFYGLAQEHPNSRILELTEVFGILREHFVFARKSLTFVASQYLHSRDRQLFGI